MIGRKGISQYYLKKDKDVLPWKIKYIDSIENVQRRATKQIPGFKNLSYEERLRRLKLPSLKFRRIRGDMIETYKILCNIYDPDVSPNLKL